MRFELVLFDYFEALSIVGLSSPVFDAIFNVVSTVYYEFIPRFWLQVLDSFWVEKTDVNWLIDDRFTLFVKKSICLFLKNPAQLIEMKPRHRSILRWFVDEEHQVLSLLKFVWLFFIFQISNFQIIESLSLKSIFELGIDFWVNFRFKLLRIIRIVFNLKVLANKFWHLVQFW